MLKRKVNLTVDGSILEAARRVAEERGTSISSLVEDFLSRIAEENQLPVGSWLAAFHKKCGISSKKELSDKELGHLRDLLGKRQA